MNPSRERVPDPVLRKVFQISGWVLASFAFATSGAILLGGRERWEGEPFRVAMQVPGAPEMWGWALFVCGCLLLAGMLFDFLSRREGLLRISSAHSLQEASRQLVVAGCTFCSAWCFAIGTTFFWQLLIDGNQVGNLEGLAWCFAGIWYLLRACCNLKALQP